MALWSLTYPLVKTRLPRRLYTLSLQTRNRRLLLQTSSSPMIRTTRISHPFALASVPHTRSSHDQDFYVNALLLSRPRKRQVELTAKSPTQCPSSTHWRCVPDRPCFDARHTQRVACLPFKENGAGLPAWQRGSDWQEENYYCSKQSCG
jgi:hypothetical protein